MLASLIDRRASLRQLGLAIAGYAPLALLMFGWPGMVASVSRACGQPPFDVRAFWNAGDAAALFEACGSAGRAAYVRLQLVDLAYPAALAWMLLVASALLLRRFGGRMWPVLLPIVGMTVLDYAENLGVWILLLRWPDLNAMLADAAGLATAVKRVLGFIAFSTPLAFGAIEFVHRARHR